MVRIDGMYTILGGLCLLGKVAGHIALWDAAMFGIDNNDPNQNNAVTPLYNMPFSEWWFHGFINKPPPSGVFMDLPSGGTYHGQVACNKAFTHLGVVPSQQTGLYACEGDGPTGGIGAMHTSDAWETPVDQIKDVKGCALSIAYTSDEHNVKPEDFSVISVNYNCPWFKNVDFDIPKGLPECPEEGCICMWGWIHSADAGSEQNYVLNYRCKVSGQTGVTPIPAPKTANKCQYPSNASNCTIGAKQPHYWLQAERNNNFQGYYDPPFYNGDYGFMNGAQTDLWDAVGGQPSMVASPPASPTSSSSATSTSSAAFTTTTIPLSSTATVSSSTVSTVSTVSTSVTTADARIALTADNHCSRRKRAIKRAMLPEHKEKHERINRLRRERLMRRSRVK